MNIDIYKMDPLREKELWGNSIFIFDSSALLDFYFLPNQTREKIYTEIFDIASNRLWIPAHVHYEYLKNREKIINKPIIEDYNPLEKEISSLKETINKTLKNKINSIINKTKKDDKHPYLEQNLLEQYNKEIEKISKITENFTENLLNDIKNKKKEIEDVYDNDDVSKAIDKYFKTGEEFTFEKIMNITKEGKHRYEFRIPPGYGDFYNKEKQGIQIFGDLIIWKQILEYAQTIDLPIIFITNDTKKDDWCYLDDKKRIKSPREELIKEIFDFSGCQFWMYNLPQFLHLANNYLNASIKEETIENLFNFIENDKEHVLEKRLLTLLDDISSILAKVNKKDFTRIYNEYIDAHIENFITGVKDYKNEDYFEYFNEMKDILKEIKSLNYTIHYQEVRMKHSTDEESIKLLSLIHKFLDNYGDQKNLDRMIEMAENMSYYDPYEHEYFGI